MKKFTNAYLTRLEDLYEVILVVFLYLCIKDITND